MALQALNIGAGDKVIVTPRTFIDSISYVVNAGAIPIFTYVKAMTGNVTVETVAAVNKNVLEGAIVCENPARLLNE